MPSDGPADRDSTPPGGFPRPGRTTYVPLNRGPHLRDAHPAPNGGPVAAPPWPGDAPADEVWPDETRSNGEWRDEPTGDHDFGWRDEPTGPAASGPGVPVPRQPGPRGRRAAGAPPSRGGAPGALAARDASAAALAAPTLPVTLPDPAGPDRTGEIPLPARRGGPPAHGAGSPGRPPGPPGPPGAPSPRRRRWWLAGLAALAVLLGGGAAVVFEREQDPVDTAANPAEPGATAEGRPPAGQPAPTPSGREGLGPNPSAAASPTPPPAGGFQPFAAPRKTLPGASLHLKGGESFSAALRRSDSTYGPLRMVRVFYPGLPPSWGGSRADVANRTVVVSFKAHPRDVNAGKHDSRLTSWFASVPRNVDVYWAYYHEPENDVESGAYTPAQFASAFRRVSGLADKAKNPRLRATLILMCWTLNPNSRRDFNAYYPGSDAVDVLGWDCYNSGTKNNRYTAPSEVFSRMISKSKALGKPWGLAETGSAKISSDSSGTGRAAWLRAMSKYLNEQKPLWVAYYDYQVKGGDFRLLDTPSQNAWKAWCQASPA